MNPIRNLYRFSTKVLSIRTTLSNYDLLKYYDKLLWKEVNNYEGYLRTFSYKSYGNKISSICISEWATEEDWEDWYTSNKRDMCKCIAESMVNTPPNQINENIFILNKSENII